MFLQTFRQFLENRIFDGKLTAADFTELVKILYYLKCFKKIFFGKILCSTQQKKCFYKLLGSFWIIKFFDGKSTAADLTKMVKICTISKCAKNFFLAKFFVPLIKISVSTKFKTVFKKLNF